MCNLVRAGYLGNVWEIYTDFLYHDLANVWVHAEQNIPGTAPPANDFSQMPWLTRGAGVDEAGNLWVP
jgi:hypothetical protein